MNEIETLRRLILILGSQVFAFFLSAGFAPYFIQLLYKFKIGQKIRESSIDGKSATIFRLLHQKKQGTPTMGGILIWGVTMFIILLTMVFQHFDIIRHSLWNRQETYLPVFTLVTVAILGLVDDYFNIKGIGKVKGIPAKPKFLWLTLFAVIGSLWFYFKLDWDVRPVHIPGFGYYELGMWIIPIFIFVIVATANAVNFTDGLDGLAGGLLVIAFTSFAIISYAQGLFILAAFCAVVTGATLGFLWFNVPPARFFMGDTGSYSLGATLGVIAMLTDSVFILPFIGFIFVIEGMSSAIQILSKKFFGKKVFRIAPLHHHLESIGWPETVITFRFWILGGFVALLATVFSIFSLFVFSDQYESLPSVQYLRQINAESAP